MPMTKKDYVLIAGVLNQMRRRVVAEKEAASEDDAIVDDAGPMLAVIEDVTDQLAAAFKAARPEFNADTFRAAVRKSDSQEG